jgi:hypothetical protein
LNPSDQLRVLGRRIRGWLPMRQAAVAGSSYSRRVKLFVAAGSFFLIFGVFFLCLELIMGGPVTYVNCLPEMSCQAIEYDTSPIMPPFLIVFGFAIISYGLYYRSRRGISASNALMG